MLCAGGCSGEHPCSASRIPKRIFSKRSPDLILGIFPDLFLGIFQAAVLGHNNRISGCIFPKRFPALFLGIFPDLFQGIFQAAVLGQRLLLCQQDPRVHPPKEIPSFIPDCCFRAKEQNL